VGFDRKEDFRSSFKEDRKSNKALKQRRKQGKAAHGRTPGSTAMPAPAPTLFHFFFGLLNEVLFHFFGGTTETSLEKILGRKLGFSVASINSIRED